MCEESDRKARIMSAIGDFLRNSGQQGNSPYPRKGKQAYSDTDVRNSSMIHEMDMDGRERAEAEESGHPRNARRPITEHDEYGEYGRRRP
jgi:hypothetical protein